ncbi:hypothetical protein ACWCQ0_53855, partial [Streptomyces massasporeus]
STSRTRTRRRPDSCGPSGHARACRCPASLFVFLSVVEGEHGPYEYKGATPEAAGPVHDAVVTFASGRKLV